MAPRNLGKRTALLVDDSAFARRHTRGLMEELGFEVSEAASGKLAIEHCQRTVPDVVLLDLVMAGMDGMETLIGLQKVCPRLKVIVVSADVQSSTQKAAREAGASAYITKPATPFTLRCTIARVLNDVAAELPPTLQEALSELMTEGYSRAARALSMLTKDRVTLEPANLIFLPIAEVAAQLAKNVGSQVVAVNQVFAGPIGGNAMLLFDQKAALLLADLVDSTEVSQEFNRAKQDTITEVGNILLNACLGVFGNLLRVQVSFAVPRLQMEDISQLFQSVTTSNALNHAVVIQSRFTLRVGQISGFFLLVLGVSSLEAVVHELELAARERK